MAARTRAPASARACSIASCACSCARLARGSRAARAQPGRGDALGLVRLGPRDRAVPVFLGDSLGLLADPPDHLLRRCLCAGCASLGRFARHQEEDRADNVAMALAAACRKRLLIGGHVEIASVSL